MKKLTKKIDLFCYNHPRFGIPNLMIYIVIGNIVMWLLCMMDTTGSLMSLLYLDPAMILKGQVWRLVTFMFIPQNMSAILTVLFCYFYWWIGSELEQHWGIPKFNIFIFSGVLLTIIYDFAVYFISGESYAVDAHYIYLSMFFSIATLFPDMQLLFMFIIPIRAKWLALADALVFLVAVVRMPFPVNLIPVVAVLNYIVFFGADLFDMLRRSRPKNNPTVTNFKREKARIKYEDRQKVYNHKCSVCGRTDTENPGLEFRYCSRCAGYHCFCNEHINSHVHFTE